MVRFVTTAYTHMYENDYVGLPGDKYRRKAPNELTAVGARVEKWRAHAGLKVADLVRRTNAELPREQGIGVKEYWAFVRGQRRISTSQIRAIAKSLGTTVHVMTHYLPGQAPDEVPAGARGRTEEARAGGRRDRASTLKPSQVGYRVEDWRRSEGISEDTLIDEANISYEMYSRFVRGKQNLTYQQLSAMASLMGISVDIMLGCTPREYHDVKRMMRAERPRQGKAREKAQHGKTPARGTQQNGEYDADEAARLLSKKFGASHVRHPK